jgi:hypothetical protein
VQLQDVITKSKGVKPENIGDDDARYLFVARATRLMIDDATAGRSVKSARCYSIETIRWFNEIVSLKPFRFQKMTIKDAPWELLHRETFFRSAVRDMMDAVIKGAVGQKRWTRPLIAELRDAADCQLAEFVLSKMTPYDEWASADFIQNVFAHLRKTGSFRHLPHSADFHHFCEHGLPLDDHERRLQKAGLIARGLCS